MRRGRITNETRSFWQSLRRLRRSQDEDKARKMIDARARAAAARLDAPPVIRSKDRGQLRLIPIDYAAMVDELIERRWVSCWFPEPKTQPFRACPSCGEPVRWLVLGGGEIPWCQKHGALEFWLVVETFTDSGPGFTRTTRRAVGYGGVTACGLWTPAA